MRHLQVQIQEKYGKVTLLGVTHSRPKRDVKFFAKKGGKSLDMKKRVYISHLGPKRHVSCEFEEKIRKNVDCINGLKMRVKTWQV